MTDTQLQFGFDAEPTLSAKPPVPTKARVKAPPISAPVAASPLGAEAMAKVLEQHPDYRVLRRLLPKLHYDGVPQGRLLHILILDTETTGLDHAAEKIIELAMLRLDIDSVTGLPVGEVQVYDELEDPGIPISKEIEAITGISNEMVTGHRLDEVKISQLLSGIDLVIAHNAGFDRPFCEARIPAFRQLAWGCSFADIDWKKEGQGSAKLTYLALEKGWFYDAHRAEADCHALLAVLCEPLPSGAPSGLSKIISASQGPSYRLQATNAPFDAKDLLKARAYRWNAEQKVWHTRLDDELALDAECEWLRSDVYGGRSARVQVEKLTAQIKYSNRAGELSVRQI